MDAFNSIFDTILLLYFAAFSWAPPAVGLALLSLAAGVGMLWVVRKTSDQAGIKRVKRAVAASLLELRVFADEPAATGRAMNALLVSNLKYMALALKPALWMALPMALLLIHLDSFYGRAPLMPGREAVVTMRMAEGWTAEKPAPPLTVPPQVQITAPPVRAADRREVSWRLLPQTPVSGDLVFMVDGQAVRKRIEAGYRQRYVPGRGVRSMLGAIWSPAEGRVASPAVEWLEIGYTDASLAVWGIEVHWLVMFCVVSLLSAMLLRKRMGVVI